MSRCMPDSWLLQKGNWESKGRDCSVYLAIGFHFLSFSQRFSHCQLRLPLRGTESPSVTERNPTMMKMTFFPITVNSAVQTQLLLRLMLDFVSLELNTRNVSPPPLPQAAWDGGRHYAQLEETHASLSVPGGWSISKKGIAEIEKIYSG